LSGHQVSRVKFRKFGVLLGRPFVNSVSHNLPYISTARFGWHRLNIECKRFFFVDEPMRLVPATGKANVTPTKKRERTW
jgi:hypothetical protein